MSKTLYTGRTFKMGRKRPIVLGPHFKFERYCLASLPEPPARTQYAQAAAPSLSNIFGNDTEGDCTIACAAHVEGVFSSNAGGPLFMPTMEQVNSMYSACEGPPGYPSIDEGCDEVTVLNYWHKVGIAGKKIDAWMTVPATNTRLCQTALWLFENLVLTVELPDEWINPFPSASGFTWNVAGPPDPQNGHAFPAVDYDFRETGKHRFEIATWGMLGKLTPAALATYMTPSAGGGCYVVLSQNAINKAQQKAPNGFNWSQLQADFHAMR